MATYVYETVPQKADEKPRRFEVVQSMKDAPLTRHPNTGEPVRRVISGGFGLMGVGQNKTTPAHTHTPACGCGGGMCGGMGE